MRRSAELRQLIHCSDAAAWTANSEHPRECSSNEGFKATTQKFVLRSDSFSAMVFRLGSILLPAVFGLNRAVGEMSPGESVFQANWAAEAK